MEARRTEKSSKYEGVATQAVMVIAVIEVVVNGERRWKEETVRVDKLQRYDIPASTLRVLIAQQKSYT